MVQLSGGGGFLGFGSYRVQVTNTTATLIDYDETQETSFSSGDATLVFDITDAGAGTYKFDVWKKSWWSWNYIGEWTEEMEWPSGPPIEWVYIN
jgi:hypothetical protein